MSNWQTQEQFLRSEFEEFIEEIKATYGEDDCDWLYSTLTEPAQTVKTGNVYRAGPVVFVVQAFDGRPLVVEGAAGGESV